MRLGSHREAPNSAPFTANGVNMAKIDSILVVGGGVAGLTAAAALSRNDLPVELVERRDTW